MARLWLRALDLAGTPATLATRFSSRDGAGTAELQDERLEAAESEIRRILSGPAPSAWFTYHNYYKAPDLVGPRVAAHFGIPYIVAEGSSARKRGSGPYARYSALADRANAAADLHLLLNGRDRAGLEAVGARTIVAMPPFIDTAEWPCRTAWRAEAPMRLACAAMMRTGDKLASYRLLAAALAQIGDGWRLDVAGDGPARGEVEALFSRFGGRVAFLGRLDAEALGAFYRRADLLVWPGVNEAFGMAYLEAAASGCPSLAMGYGGVGEVVADGASGWLSPAGDAAAYARALAGLIADPLRVAELGRGAARLARSRHDIVAAAATLSVSLGGPAGEGALSCVS